MERTNTVDEIGVQATLDGLISGTLEEFVDNKAKELGGSVISYMSSLKRVYMQNLTTAGNSNFYKCALESISDDMFPNLTSIGENCFRQNNIQEASF